MQHDSSKILITGSSGLIGTALMQSSLTNNLQFLPFDIKNDKNSNILYQQTLEQAMKQCQGVIHLAAVSRVIWGERDPTTCWQVNVEGTKNVLQAALAQIHKPWVIYASSREVYGQSHQLPVTETTQLNPMNVYARSKVAAEQAIQDAQTAGLQATIVRFSSVYGSVQDHPDRVVPAFAKAAALGTAFKLEGSQNAFDFTHVNDTVDGIIKLIHLMQASRQSFPPIHFTTGIPTTLLELATLANQAGKQRSSFVEAPSRQFDVSKFYADPSRAKQLLNWQPTTTIQEGIQQLVDAFTQTLHLMH